MGWGGGGKKGPAAGKGWGKGKGFGKGDMVLPGDNDEFIWEATTKVVEPIMHLERELDQTKLEKRIRDTFKKAAKDMNFSKPWWELIGEYAENAFTGLFNSLGDREWLVQFQCDLLPCLDAGIKDAFPREVLQPVMRIDFEQTVLAAYDRFFQEQRNLPVIWETMTSFVEGPKGKKKVFAALETGWKQAFVQFAQFDVQSFVGCWIDSTIANLSEACNGEPQYTLEEQSAIKLWDALLQAGTLPYNLVEQFGPPPARWPFVQQSIRQSYRAHSTPEEAWSKPKRKRTWNGGGGYNKRQYRESDQAVEADETVNADDDDDALTRALQQQVEAAEGGEFAAEE
jgi:hypothetical protein